VSGQARGGICLVRGTIRRIIFGVQVRDVGAG
jgi:hypothetical protein